jgi:Ca-activated chloride channel homolog
MKSLITCLLLLSLGVHAEAQQGRADIRQGNRQFKNEKFDEAEISYRKALEAEKADRIAGFNLGDALYRQEKFEEAGQQFEAAAATDAVKANAARSYHNLGNSLLQAGKLEESIEAYKNALRRNPDDLDTKYNLSYAQMMKKKQDQQKQQEGQDENKDNKDNKENKGDQDNKKEDQGDQQQQQQQQDQQSGQQEEKQQAMKISREDAKRLLEALANDEKKVQEKVKKEKANASKVRSLKDW